MSTKSVYYAISHGSLTLVFAFDSNQPVRVDPVVSEPASPPVNDAYSATCKSKDITI